ncbi:hypothetical protein [Sediminibacillus massiliensis]|nr:hypothetical protein [Sediminibacillus massiliensis]
MADAAKKLETADIDSMENAVYMVKDGRWSRLQLLNKVTEL